MEARTRSVRPGRGHEPQALWAHETFRRVIDSAHDAFVSIDADGIVLWWNRMAEATFGWSAEEAIGSRLAELIVPERYREAHEHGLREYARTGEGRVVGRRLELEAVHRDGHELPVELTISPLEADGHTVFNAFLHDISERRRADSTNNLLARITEGSDNAIVAIDSDATITAWNAGAEAVLGCPAAQMLGRSILPFWREDRGRFEEMQRNLTVGERVPTFDARIVRANGAVIDAAVKAYPLDDGGGGPPGMSVIFRDVTEQRAAAASSLLLTELVASSEDAIVTGTLDGRVTTWNPGAERLYGYTAEEMVGESIAKVRPEGSLEDFREIQATISSGRRVPPFETEELRKDGSRVLVSVSLAPVKDAAGRVTGISSIVRDISERRRAERESKRALQRFESAFESAPIGMALVAPDGSFIAVNAALCRLLARPQETLLATTFQAVTHPDDLEADLDELRRTLTGEIGGYEIEKRYVRPGGEVVWVILSVTLLRDEAGEPLHFISQIQDITERKQAEEELRSYTAHLAELALKDPVTGLRNQRDFDAILDTELERARRHGGNWSVLALDIDGFGQINRGAGHPEGDRVLTEVGAAIDSAARASDISARIGSDEFALILPETSGADARRTAERISCEVARRLGGVTVSIGWSSWPDDGDSKAEVLREAQARLAASKPAAAEPAVHAGAGNGRVEGIDRILDMARQQLGMEVAYLAEMDSNTQVFRAISGEAHSFGVEEGTELARGETYCARMLDGRIPRAVPDIRLHPQTREMPVTTGAGVGAYVGVPVSLSDGRLYGTLCCVSHAAKPELVERHLELMGFLADLIVEHIDREEHQAGEMRSEIELAGINALLSALVARDHYTGEHSRSVVRRAAAVAGALELGEEEVREVEQVALLHDIGKVGVPDTVLQKRGPLDEQEWALMRQHPAIGARILAGTETLSHLAPAVKAEHERFDGAGYPDGLAGQEIPLASRITLACDAYHAMTSDRPYRAALAPEQAVDELHANAGTQFDPRVVEALVGLVRSGR